MSMTTAARNIWRGWRASGAPRSAFPRSGWWRRPSARWRQLPTYHIFNGRSNEPMIELAEALLKIAPKGLGKVLFANSGSEANDQAAKIVWFYNNAIGRPRKKKIISRVRAYHGITVFSGSMTGLPPNHNDFDLPVGGVLRTDCPSHYLYRPAGRERARLRRSARRQSRADDHPRRARHHRGLHRRAGERRGRRDRAAARLFSRGCRKCCAATTSCSSPTR